MNWNKQKEEKLISICQELIKIPSFSGEEGNLVKKIEEILKQYNFNDFFVDKYGSIIGKIKGTGIGKKILFDAHIDTVPISNPSVWKYNPFGGEIHDGKLYGRGTTDMKASLGAMILAASLYKESTNSKFNGEILIAGVVHEECFEGIAAREISSNFAPDFVVIG